MNPLWRIALVFAWLGALAACSAWPAMPGTSVAIWRSPALELWFTQPEQCAAEIGLTLVEAPNPADANLLFGFGTPPQNSDHVYQVGSGAISVISNDATMASLDAAAITALFTSPPPKDLQVWVYPPEDDLTRTFVQDSLGGKALYPASNVALNNQQMILGVLGSGRAVGVLPTALQTGQFTELARLEDVPILAAAAAEPQGAVLRLLQCLQTSAQ